MNFDDVLTTIKAIRKDKAEAYNYWEKTKKKIRPSERAMALASYKRELEALDRTINILLREQVSNSPKDAA